MGKIKLHPIDTDFIKEYCEWKENTSLVTHKKFENDDLGRLNMLSNTCQCLIGYYTHLKENKTKAINYFLLTQRAMKWYFKMATEEKGKITRIRLNDEWTFNIEAYPIRDFVDCSSWEETLYDAVIARDKEAIEWLLEFPEARMRDATSQGPEYTYLYVDFLKAYFKKSPDVGKKLLQAYKSTDPSLVYKEYMGTMLNHDAPIFDLWASFLSDKEEEFNQRLEKALLLYRDYCSDDPKNAYILISYPLTALAAMAHDRGWKLTVSSDYMPEWMIKGVFGK